MAVISFWSNSKKQVGQTMSIVAIASMMAIEHNYKILLLTTKNNDDTLELCFGSDKTKPVSKLFSKAPTVSMDNGIEGLYKAANSGRLNPEAIPNYTKPIYKNRLEVIYGYKNQTDILKADEQSERINERYKDIIQTATKYYDMVFVDLEKGLDNDVTNQILSISDVIVVNIEQKLNLVNDFIKSKEENILKENNIILNIGNFDDYSKYSLKNIARYTGMKKDICCVPYNTLFMEAASEENVADLFLKIIKVSEMDINNVFIKAVKDAKEKILYKIQEVQMRV